MLYSILLFVNGSVVLGLNQFELIFKSQRISEHISLICTSLCALMGSAEQSHQQVQSRVEATQAGRTTLTVHVPVRAAQVIAFLEEDAKGPQRAIADVALFFSPAKE